MMKALEGFTYPAAGVIPTKPAMVPEEMSWGRGQ
jgi:hypothetical protein